MMGWILVISSWVITTILWLVVKMDVPAPNLARGASQILALIGIMGLSWTYIFALRNKLVERLFGGLDRMYKAHHIIGGISFVALLNHALLLVVGAMPENRFAFYFLPSTRLSFTYGQASLYVMLVLLVLTFYVKLPYRLWKWTHEWMGLVIILGGLHTMLIRSDTLTNMPLRYWILGWCAIATLAFLHKRFIYYFFPRPVKYLVKTLSQQGELLVISLESVGKPIQFEPGQYGFFSLPKNKRDEHPLTVLGSEGTRLIMGIKVIGKFTHKLADLKEDSEVYVRGPFGLLAEKMINAKHAVWIAGGIGITPFLSMAKNIEVDQRVDMYFCAKIMPAQVITEPFESLSKNNPNFRWLPCETSTKGRVTGQQILDNTGNDKNAIYLLCGPSEMMESIASQLAVAGIKRSRIVYEDFAFK